MSMSGFGLFEGIVRFFTSSFYDAFAVWKRGNESPALFKVFR
jgi:beta-xylosidase